MANEILQGVAEDFASINPKIQEAEDIIKALKEAGEPVGELESQLRQAKMRRDKWQNMLNKRGLKI